ncbi:MAG TPA: SpoIIE family protein phosphatase [Spirochaetota bacterium]|nr:SpoIIE family protein phosphatase [Spirochaetota bacterium]
MINAAERTLVMGDAACAMVLTGSDKIRSGYGNGDCLLLDFKHSVFALSDGAERYARASRLLLERLSEAIEVEGVPTGTDEWRDLVNRVYSRQRYQHKATFSCAALAGPPGSRRLVVIHGGDSMVFVVNKHTGAIEFRTGVDMSFAGRSKTVTNVTEIDLKKGEYRIVICSDGLIDVARFAGRDIAGLLSSTALRAAVRKIPERVKKIISDFLMREAERDYDDISFIVLEPSVMNESGDLRMVMGGTSPGEEEEYQRRVLPERIFNRWLGVGEMAAQSSLINSCGIRIL